MRQFFSAGTNVSGLRANGKPTKPVAGPSRNRATSAAAILLACLSPLTASAQSPAPAEPFSGGQLGVAGTEYRPEYLLVAYRYLAGSGLTATERDAIFAQAGAAAPTGGAPWLAARNALPGVKAVQHINQYKTNASATPPETYLNCGDDAFSAAASTLARLARKYGEGSDPVKSWVAAQDLVFANCSGGPSIPKATADPDRAYQVAAAKFYARQFDEARQDFEAIAKDATSPWKAMAPYLVARCLIRKADYAGAEKQLRAILADPALSERHEAARRLLGLALLRSAPRARLHELAQAVIQPNSTTLRQDAIDYLYLLKSEGPKAAEDDITDWMLTMAPGGTAAHAMEQWKAKASLPWLVAALAKAERAEPELLAAARAVTPDSPAYASAVFHAARFLPENDARQLVAAALRNPLPAPVQNDLRAVLMKYAHTLDEFLLFARRASASESAVEGAKVEPEEFLDADAAHVLNRKVPLHMLATIAQSEKLPKLIRDNLSEAVFVRALLLGNPPDRDNFLELLRSPGLHPYVDAGPGRTLTGLGMGDNPGTWWCSAGGESQFVPGQMTLFESPALRLLYGKSEPDAPFLSAADRQQAATEWAALQRVPVAANWLATQTLEWMQTAPKDPRGPEALSLAVRATRLGCPNEETVVLSKKVYDMLHSRYPASEFAKKTTAWYGKK
jgi:hypothetical protein